MADFRPFRAWRYNPEKVDFQQVIAPPYDVISEEAQEKFYRRSPHSCIRLILNKIEASDTETNNRYTRARDCFAEWRREGILVREEKPCFYLYRQTFHELRPSPEKTRIALLGRLKLEPFEKGVVVPHEKTLSKPKEDRRKLLEATETNFSPIFGLYDDPKKEVGAVIRGIFNQAPFYRAVDDENVRHEVWILDDPKVIEKLQTIFKHHKIYIADGHHRYQTSLDHSVRVREKLRTPQGTEIPSDFILMALVDFYDPGLVLMPTHRMILPFEGLEPETAVKALEPFFDIQKMAADKIFEELRKNTGASKKDDGRVSFGLIFKTGASFLIRLKDPRKAKEKMGIAKADAWCGLDVVLLNHLILAKLWNLPESQWEATIRYTHSDEEAVASVKNGKAEAVFLLQDPPVKILREMGDIRELLPQKTTYFYPKLASGLVFHQHQ